MTLNQNDNDLVVSCLADTYVRERERLDHIRFTADYGGGDISRDIEATREKLAMIDNLLRRWSA